MSDGDEMTAATSPTITSTPPHRKGPEIPPNSQSAQQPAMSSPSERSTESVLAALSSESVSFIVSPSNNTSYTNSSNIATTPKSSNESQSQSQTSKNNNNNGNSQVFSDSSETPLENGSASVNEAGDNISVVIQKDTETEGGDENDNDDDSLSANDQSQSENNPDTFHTPSASLQNLSMTTANSRRSGNSGSPALSDSGHSSSSNNTNITNSNNEFKEKSENEQYQHVSNESLSQATTPTSPDFLLLSTKAQGNSNNKDELLTVSNEFLQSMESNVSRESSSSSSKETLMTAPMAHAHYSTKLPNKKKMWYHVFTTSYKTRSADFKRIFKELPTEERLIVDYSCALQKDILIQGRMYVSQNYISFYANIFGWETQTSIRLKDITSITKEKTALVIPNAVQVTTENEKFFFTSFVTRDATYVMLFKLWQGSLLEDVRDTMPTKEIWKLVHSCYGEELGVGSEEETEDFLTCDPGRLMSAASVTTLLSASDADDNKSIGIDQVCASDMGTAIAVGVNLGSSIVASNGIPSPASILLREVGDAGSPIPLTTDLSDTSDSEGEAEPHVLLTHLEEPIIDIPTCPVAHSQGKETVNAIIPCDVDQLFTMLFTNSKFYLDLHTSRKTFDIVQSQWQQSPDGSHKVRQLSFTVTLNHVMGPKHSQVTETQTMLPVSKPGRMYAIDSESVNSGIPYADSFYVTTHFCLSRVSANESRLIIVNQIKFKKSVWGITKTFIEKNSWVGIDEFYNHLKEALKEECVKINAIGQSPSASPRITANSLPRRRHPRKKGKAPDVPVGAVPLLCAVRNGSISTANVCVAGSIPNANITVPNPTVSSEASQTIAEGSTVLKIILSILACLLLLNAFLYIKLARLETAANTPIIFPPQPFAMTKDMPQSHQEWLLLLQQQEALHRIELQKWHEILTSALKILHQAESDLESLKLHITSYSSGKFSVSAVKDTSEESSIPKVSQEQNEAVINTDSMNANTKKLEHSSTSNNYLRP